jgi:OOP family OmpA-OmpF porin
MSKLRILGVLAAAGILAGCASDIDRVRTVEATGSPFTQALTEEYRQLAVFEADEMYDWPDAGYFARKGLAAAAGETVLPEELANWDLPADKVDEMSSARARLMTALDGGGRDVAPELAARAQARFDCWVEQQEENHQLDHIAACRDEFYRALAELEAALAPKQEMAAPPEVPETYLILFDWDRSDINAAGQAVVQQILSDAQARGTPQISITGHADRSGPADYNLRLSERRADSVREALIAGGIAADMITTAWRGESEPAVPTADGVREQANRRAEVIIQ